MSQGTHVIGYTWVGCLLVISTGENLLVCMYVPFLLDILCTFYDDKKPQNYIYDFNAYAA